MKQLVKEARHRTPDPHQDTCIAICGAGTLGGNLAEALARRGFQRLRIIDRDWVEEQDLPSQPFQPRDIGTPKARSLARSLYGLAGAEADPQVVELTELNAPALLAGSAIVVDTLDNTAGRRAVADTCATLDLPCLHLDVDVDGRRGLLYWDGEQPATGRGDQGESPLSLPLANRLVDAGCESIVRFLLSGVKRGDTVSVEN